MCVSTVILLINNIDAISSFVLPTNISLLIATDPFAKTIIFCEDIDHAERMRKAIVNAAGQIPLDSPNMLCVSLVIVLKAKLSLITLLIQRANVLLSHHIRAINHRYR